METKIISMRGIGDDASNLPSGVFDHYDDEGKPVDKNGLYVSASEEGSNYGLPAGAKSLQDIIDAVQKGLISAEAAYAAYQGKAPANAPNPFKPSTNISSMSSWLLPVAIVGVGAILLMKKKSKTKTISGMKHMKHLVDFSGANFKKEALPTITDIAVITGSIIASRKFIDLQKVLPATFTATPTGMTVVKHQGGAKLVLGFLIANVAKHHVLKNIGVGVAIDGAIQEARVFFANSDGSNAIPSISGIVPTARGASNNVIGWVRLPSGQVIQGVQVQPNETVRRSASSVISGDKGRTQYFPTTQNMPVNNPTVSYGY